MIGAIAGDVIGSMMTKPPEQAVLSNSYGGICHAVLKIIGET